MALSLTRLSLKKITLEKAKRKKEEPKDGKKYLMPQMKTRLPYSTSELRTRYGSELMPRNPKVMARRSAVSEIGV
jgi:hypothetical protein